MYELLEYWNSRSFFMLHFNNYKIGKEAQLNSFMGFFPYYLEENLKDDLVSSDPE